jgi:hypothetical protein
MKIKKTFFIIGLITMITILIPAAPVFGGIEPPLPGSQKIVGPEMWAVGIITDLGSGIVATLRVKKIEGCNVDTDPQIETNLPALPQSSTDIIWFRLESGSVFGLCPIAGHQPIITKVKNFKNEGSIVSFDAQIKFVVPIGAADTVCTPTP